MIECNLKPCPFCGRYLRFWQGYEMSALIKNFVMPETCDNCPFCACYVRSDGSEDAYRCCVTMKIITDFDRRADWCPLVEIPTDGFLVAAPTVIGPEDIE